MDNILNPDVGLMITTIVTFLCLIGILTKVAWKPIISGLNERESKIRNDIERAEKSQKEAEDLRQKYETQLAAAQKSIQDMVSQAKADGEKTRAQMLTEAKEESERILAKGKKELAGQTDMLKEELKKEVSALTLSVTEKVLQRSADKKLVDDLVAESLKNLQGSKS